MLYPPATAFTLLLLKIYFAYVLCLHDFFFKFHALTAFFLEGVIRCISISVYTGVYIGSFVYFEKQKREQRPLSVERIRLISF
jgi:hypothetical protein